MARLTFHGAIGTVTGSRHLLDIDGRRLLIDCGLFQGTKENRLKNWEPFPVPPSSIDNVLLTHAHIDHSGYLPRFCREGFAGKVFCTHATRELAGIMLKDTAHLQEEDAHWANKIGFSRHAPAQPLFTVDDAKWSLKFLKSVHYGDTLPINDSIRVKFRDAGHLLGSSFIDLRASRGSRKRKILFSGDIGRAARPLLHDPEQVYNIDYLVLESTYGNRLHEAGSPNNELARIVNESLHRGGVLVIPAFSIGRTQAVLYVLRELEENGAIPEIPVYVDSPMAIEAVNVFEKRLADLDLSSRLLAVQGKRFLRPRWLHLTRTRAKSKKINEVEGRAIIIAASGMAVGGRILHHLQQRLPGPENTVLLVGHQAEGTRGRSLMNGEKFLKIHGQSTPVRAKVENLLGFSAHADYQEILAWMLGFNRPPEKVFLVHGEPDACRNMAMLIRKTFSCEAVIPEPGQSFELDL